MTASVPGDRVTAPYIDRTIDAGIVAVPVVPVVPAILTPTVSTQISATTVSWRGFDVVGFGVCVGHGWGVDHRDVGVARSGGAGHGFLRGGGLGYGADLR